MRRGDLLAVIDKVPFQLAVDERQAARAGGDADDRRRPRRHGRGAGPVGYGDGAAGYTAEEQQRVAALIADDTVSHQQSDQANEALQRAQAQTGGARGGDRPGVADAGAAPSIWRKESGDTGLRAMAARADRDPRPVDGTVNNLTVQVGDTADAARR